MVAAAHLNQWNTEPSANAATCAICQEDFRVADRVRTLVCGHRFHCCQQADCEGIHAWKARNGDCPLCRD
jgi:hypothetical protein